MRNDKFIIWQDLINLIFKVIGVDNFKLVFIELEKQ